MLGHKLTMFLSLVFPIIAAPLGNVGGNVPVLDRRNEPAVDVASANVVVRGSAIKANVKRIESKPEVRGIIEVEEEDANDADVTFTEKIITDFVDEKRGVRPGGNVGGQRRGVRSGNNIGGAKRGVRPGGNVGGHKRGVRPGGSVGGN